MASIDDDDFVSPNSIPADTLAAVELKESLNRLQKQGYSFVALDKAPTDVEGCDDYGNRFQWWIRYDPKGKVEGYFHTVKGFEL